MRFAEDYQVAEKALEAASAVVLNPSVPPAQKLSELQIIINFLLQLFH